MKFTQTIEFSTTRIDDFNAHLDEWITTSEGRRIPHRAVLRSDREADNVYQLTVEFSSHETAMANSSRPETAAFASFLGEISDGGLAFRNFDVVREEEL